MLLSKSQQISIPLHLSAPNDSQRYSFLFNSFCLFSYQLHIPLLDHTSYQLRILLLALYSPTSSVILILLLAPYSPTSILQPAPYPPSILVITLYSPTSSVILILLLAQYPPNNAVSSFQLRILLLASSNQHRILLLSS